MIIFAYAIPLAAWVAFIYVQHHHGDRPTTHNWWALMTALGVFELCKGIFGQVAPDYAFTLALATAFVSGGIVQIMWVRTIWTSDKSSEEFADDLLVSRTH